MSFEKIMALALLIGLIIAPVSVLTAASQSYQAEVTGQVNLAATHSVVDLQVTGSSTEPSNATGTLELSITGSSDHTSLSGQGNINFVIKTSSAPDFRVNIQGTGQFDGANFSSQAQVSIYANLSSTSSGGYSLETSAILPSQIPPIPITTTSYPGPIPPMPPGGNLTGPMVLHFNLNVQTSGWIKGLNGHIETQASGDFNLTNGAMILGMPGDIVGTITYHSVNHIVNGTSVKDSTTNITFNSGNTQVDTFIAQTLYQYLSSMGSYGMNTTIDVQLSGTSIIIVTHTVSNMLSPQMPQAPMMPGMPGGMGPGMPGMGMMNVTLTPTMNMTMMPLFYENASGQGSFSLTIEGNPAQGTITVNGQFSGSIDGINPDSMAFFPTSIQVNGQVNEYNGQLSIHVEGDGDPSVAFETAKGFLLTFKHGACQQGTTINVNMQTDGSVHFYNAVTGEDLGTTLTVTCSNLEDLMHIIVAPEGTTVKPSMKGVLEVESQNEVKLGMASLMSMNMVKVHAKKIEVNTGLVVISTPKTFHMITTEGHQVVVKIMENTMINGKLMIESLTQDEANSMAQSHGYSALGPGVKVEGIGKGAAKIQLPISGSGSGVAVLEISADGSTKLITNVIVAGNGTVIFTANSFSTFIPVASGVPGTTTETTVTTSETQHPGTTSTETETGETMTTTTGGTTGTGGATETETTTTGGTNTALIAGVVILLVIIGAAAFYIMRR